LETKHGVEKKYTKTKYITGSRKIHEIKHNTGLLCCLPWCIEVLPKNKENRTILDILKKAQKDDRLFVRIIA